MKCVCGHSRWAHGEKSGSCYVLPCTCVRYRRQGQVEVSASKDLHEFTKELVDSLDGYDRAEAIARYHEWIKSARLLDRREARKLDCRIYNFLVRRREAEELSANTDDKAVVLRVVGGDVR